MPRLLLFALLFSLAYAQITSNATCITTFGWALNSHGQDPCLAAAYLQSSCSAGSSKVAALEPNSHYSGPSSDEINPCKCSSVVYSLISACSACQSAPYESWGEWNENCPTVYLQVYPMDIPEQTSVPIWAYMTIQGDGTFNLTAAEIVASQGIPDRFSQTNVSAIPSSPSTLSPNMEKAIIGIIAAVLFLLLVSAVSVTILQIRRNRRRRRETRNGHINSGYFRYETPPSFSNMEPLKHIREHTTVIDAALRRSLRGSLAPTVSSRHHREESADTLDSMVPLMTTHTALPMMPRSDPGRGLPSLMTSPSELSLPSMFAPQEEEDVYTPAAESSDMYNTTAGHSPASERIPSRVMFRSDFGLPPGCLPPQRQLTQNRSSR